MPKENPPKVASKLTRKVSRSTLRLKARTPGPKLLSSPNISANVAAQPDSGELRIGCVTANQVLIDILNGLLRSTDEPFFSVDTHYRYTSYNDSHAKFMKELYNANIDIGGSLLDYMVAEEYRINAQKNLDRALRGESFIENVCFKLSQYNKQFFKISHLPLRDSGGIITGVLVTARDETALNDLEGSLELTEIRFRQFFNANIVGLIIANSDGRVSYANDHYLKLVGYSREEFDLGLVNWRDMTPPEFLSVDLKALSELRTSGVCTPYQKEYVRKDGTRVPVYLTDVLLDGPDEPILAIAIDLSPLKEKEREIAASQEQLRSANQRLEKEQASLQNKHTALCEIVELLETEHKRIRAEIMANVDRIITPQIARIKAMANKTLEYQIILLENAIRDVTSPHVHNLSKTVPTLSARELEVSELIRRGHTSKDISGALGISVLTVHKLRQRIRKKLGIANMSQELTEYFGKK